MTMIDEIQKMTDNQIDEAIATEVMGWFLDRIDIDMFWYKKDRTRISYESWDCVNDLNQCYEAEERIIELGLVSNYLVSLQFVVVFSEWAMVHATARQRCEAMLMAVREGNG